VVRTVPALLTQRDPEGLVRELAEELERGPLDAPGEGDRVRLLSAVDRVFATLAWIAVTFAMLLGALHRGRSIDDLSPMRATLTGALSGVLIPGAALGVATLAGQTVELPAIQWILGTMGVAGALTAGGSVYVGRLALANRPSGAASALEDGSGAPELPASASAAPKKSAPPKAPKAAAPKAKPKAAPAPPADDDIDQDALAEALKDDLEIARLLAEDP